VKTRDYHDENMFELKLETTVLHGYNFLYPYQYPYLSYPHPTRTRVFIPISYPYL
jgi:hypothetical protein